MKKINLTLLLALLSLAAFSQNRRFQYKQYIPMKYWVHDSYTINKGDSLKLSVSSIIKTKKEVDKKGKKTVYTSYDTLRKDSIIYFEKVKEFKRKLPGYANVHVKEDDYSKIFLDYWLNTPTYFPKGSIFTFSSEGNKPKTDTLKSPGRYRYYTVPDTVQTQIKDALKKIETLTNEIDSISSLQYNGSSQVNYEEARKTFLVSFTGDSSKVEKPLKKNLKEIKKEKSDELAAIYKDDRINEFLWSSFSKEKISVVSADKNDNTTYFKKYPENAYIKLENRQYIKLKFSAWEMAALTIPFKYRFETSQNSITVPSEFSTDINISTFVGRTTGSLIYKNQASKKIKPHGSAISTGAFFGFSIVEIDSASTSLLGDEALTEKRTVLAFSPGLGAVYNFMDFNVGLFFGWDIGLGNTAQKWNYSNKPWLGFGIGYNLTMLGKKED